jgi:hypothetical protein
MLPLPFMFPNQIFIHFSSLPHVLMSHPSQSHCLDHPNNIVHIYEMYKVWSCSLCSFLQLLATSSLLDSNIFLRTLFSGILNLCSSHSVRETVIPIQKTGKLVVLYILIFKPLKRRQVDKRLNRMVTSISQT